MRIAHRREEGVVLFIAVLLLALMGALGIAALDSASRDQQSAGYYNRSNTALFAAEAGVAAAKAIVKASMAANPNDCPTVKPFPNSGNAALLGDATLYAAQGALPRYYGDPAAANAVECLGYAQMGMSRVGSQTQQRAAMWKIAVVGESPDGSRVRLEVMHLERIN